MCKHQFIWIFIVVDPGINILLGVLSVWIHLHTTGTPPAENRSRYKPAWCQQDMVRNYLADGLCQIHKYFTHFTDLLKTNQSPGDSFSCSSFSSNFSQLALKQYHCEVWGAAAALSESHIWTGWRSQGSQHWDHGIPKLWLCFVPRLPSVPQTTTPPSADGCPTRGQAASVCANSSVSCAVLHICVCVCVCWPTSACLSQASA